MFINSRFSRRNLNIPLPWRITKRSKEKIEIYYKCRNIEIGTSDLSFENFTRSWSRITKFRNQRFPKTLDCFVRRFLLKPFRLRYSNAQRSLLARFRKYFSYFKNFHARSSDKRQIKYILCQGRI